MFKFWNVLLLLVFCGCKEADLNIEQEEEQEEITEEQPFYVGADLSYVNEMLDCGGVFRSEQAVVEPYAFFAAQGTQLVRLRLWHTPDWTNYSNLADVKRSIQAAKANNMKVLLDFHYSDDWADPGKQLIPEAWANVINDRVALGDSLYNYTYNVLTDLKAAQLLPEIVQIGNEINSEILVQQPAAERNSPINWNRNAFLLNRGLLAVQQFNEQHDTKLETMLHIAQPENAFWWFAEATANGIQSFDWIGLSYYPKWSDYSLEAIDVAIDSLIQLYGKKVMIVETAYPYTLTSFDAANNIMNQDALVENYPATPQGQRQFLIDLTQKVKNGGGSGVIYWEPAWISTACGTRWGDGSHWENATFFDASNNNEALASFDFFTYEYQ